MMTNLRVIIVERRGIVANERTHTHGERTGTENCVDVHSGLDLHVK